jgi:hypothetical protein
MYQDNLPTRDALSALSYSGKNADALSYSGKNADALSYSGKNASLEIGTKSAPEMSRMKLLICTKVDSLKMKRVITAELLI